MTTTRSYKPSLCLHDNLFWVKKHQFSVRPVGGRVLFSFASADPSIFTSSSRPRLCQIKKLKKKKTLDGWTGPKEEDKSRTEELLHTLRKCFITFRKGCQGFSHSTHDPCFISSLVSIFFPLFFSSFSRLKTHCNCE